jgi:HK97 gp10 family phage protein
VSFEIKGLEELQRAMRQFPDAAKAGARKGLEKTAPKVATGAGARAPKRTLKLATSMAHVIRGIAGGVKAMIGTPVFYARFQELGTRKMGANPFLTPEVEADEEEIRRDMVTEIAREIDRLPGAG